MYTISTPDRAQLRARIKSIVEAFDVTTSFDTKSERERYADALADALLEVLSRAERPDHGEEEA